MDSAVQARMSAGSFAAEARAAALRLSEIGRSHAARSRASGSSSSGASNGGERVEAERELRRRRSSSDVVSDVAAGIPKLTAAEGVKPGARGRHASIDTSRRSIEEAEKACISFGVGLVCRPQPLHCERVTTPARRNPILRHTTVELQPYSAQSSRASTPVRWPPPHTQKKHPKQPPLSPSAAARVSCA